MVAALARELPDDTVCFNGAVSFIPVTAFLLARATHAPGLIWVASSIAVDPRPERIGESTLATPSGAAPRCCRARPPISGPTPSRDG